jgi:hypothetical protein
MNIVGHRKEHKVPRPISTQTRKNGALGTRYSRADNGARSRHGRRDDEFGRDYAKYQNLLSTISQAIATERLMRGSAQFKRIGFEISRPAGYEFGI